MADGKGCRCEARGACECGCEADWTPQEVYDLRAKLKHQDERVKELESCLRHEKDGVDVYKQQVQSLEARVKEAESIQDQDTETITTASKKLAACGERIQGLLAQLAEKEKEIEDARNKMVLDLDANKEGLQSLSLLQLVAKALNGIFWRDREIKELKAKLSSPATLGVDVVSTIDNAIRRQGWFSQSRIPTHSDIWETANEIRTALLKKVGE